MTNSFADYSTCSLMLITVGNDGGLINCSSNGNAELSIELHLPLCSTRDRSGARVSGS